MDGLNLENGYVEVEYFGGDWIAFLMPSHGREAELSNIDCCVTTGLYSFSLNVHWTSHYYIHRDQINHWIKNECKAFVLDGVTYNSIEDLSIEMWLEDVRLS